MTAIAASPMPTVVEDDHVFFDHEVIGPGLHSPFFPFTTMWIHKKASKKFGVDTNLIGSGSCVPAGCEADIDWIRITAKDLPEGTPLDVRLSCGTKKTDFVVDVGTWQKLDLGRTSPHFTGTESFAFEVIDAPVRCEAKLEIKGRFWRPDYASPDWEAWCAGHVAETEARLRSYGCPLVAQDHDALYDTERLTDGEARLFVDSRHFADGRGDKQFWKHTNLVGSGSSLPRSWLFRIDAISVEALEEGGLQGPLEVCLLTNGVERVRATLHPVASIFDRRQIDLKTPVVLLECEAYVVEVRGNGGLIKVLLIGQSRKPRQ